MSNNINPLTGQPFSEQYYTIKKAIDSIPASKPEVRQELGDLLDKHDIILLTGETGSGKSVRVPSLVLEHYGFNAQIVCTQPRTVNASNISDFVSKILDVKLGDEVGYKFKHNDKTSSKTKLLYATDGTIVAQQFGEQTRGEELFNDFDVVIIDEAHERSVQIDFLLLFIKRYLDAHKPNAKGGKDAASDAADENAVKDNAAVKDVIEDVVSSATSITNAIVDIHTPKPKRRAAAGLRKKFVIMSATMELDTFRRYFAGISMGEMSISGRTFPVERFYLPKPNPDYMPAIEEKIITIINGKPLGDILVFLSSKREIDNLINNINEKIIDKLNEPVVAVPLYSGLTPEATNLAVSSTAFKEQPISKIIGSDYNGNKQHKNTQRGKSNGKHHGKRGKQGGGNIDIATIAKYKIVVSTEIAETGVTVDGIVYVIESGRVLESSFDTTRRENVLNNAFIPKAAVKQRIGRAGRTRPGIAYHMYTEAEYENFDDFKQPDIRTTNIDGELMKLLKFPAVKDVSHIKQLLHELIEPPSELQIKSTLRFLAVVGVISSDKPNGTITALGECVYPMRIDTQLAISLLSAQNYGVDIDSALSVIAILQTEPNLSRWFVQPSMNDKDAMKAFRDFKSKYTSSYGDVFSLYRLYSKFRERKLGKDERFVRKAIIFEALKNRRTIQQTYKDIPSSCHLERVGPTAAKMEKSIVQMFMPGYYSQTATLSQKKSAGGKEIYTYVLDSPPAPELGKQTIDVELGRDNAMSRLSKKIMYLGVSNINGTRKFNGIFNIDDADILAKIDKLYSGGYARIEQPLANMMY